MDIEKLTKNLNVDEKKAKSIAFWVIDFLLDNISDKAIDCGAYYNSPLNGDERMIKSYKEILWAQFEEIQGNEPSVAGPWVEIDLINGITLHKERS